MFSLLYESSFATSTVVHGWPDHVLPVHNINAVAESKFYLIGKIIATGLVQGGEPPVCFSAAVADFIIYDSAHSKSSIDDILDHDVRDALRRYLYIIEYMYMYVSYNYCSVPAKYPLQR